MKNISTELENHLLAEVTNLAFCWKLSYKDGRIVGFTTHDNDIVFENITYKSKAGFAVDEYKINQNSGSENLDVFGVIDSDDITETDIASGSLDNAALEIFVVNYNDVGAGKVIIKTGKISKINKYENAYIIGISGIADELEKNITENYSPLCRANFGDVRCGINKNLYKFSGEISEVLSDISFKDSSRTEQIGYYDKGVIKFTSALNEGFSGEVKRSEGNKITLSLAMPKQLQIGDEYEIIAGCNKKFSTCKNKFNNVLNFRGEPDLPGVEKTFKVL